MTVLRKNLAVVAMSGGVDSSVAALLLKEQGLEVIGISMKTHDSLGSLGPAEPEPRLNQGEIPLPPGLSARRAGGSPRYPPSASKPHTKTCCAAQDIQDARRVCQQLDIPFYPLNYKEEFRENVIQYFAEEYSQGRTPNPCVLCNSQLKFSALLKQARQLGAYYLATGHYVQRSRDRNGRYHLLKARDRDKDQSYFLFGLSQIQLEHILFPLGRYEKGEVRELARGAGLQTAEKPESQEICFVTSGDYADFVEAQLPALRGSKGVIVDREGRVLGEHAGIHHYTIGQRKGLGVAAGDRLYVTELRPAENKVVLGPRESLMKNGIIVKRIQWVVPEMISSGLKMSVRIRYRHPEMPSHVTFLDEESVRIDFERPDGAITPGQVAVFYRGDELIGGGWIERGIS